MKLLKLALRNLLGNGLKTWLNVFVLSISFVLIIFSMGLLEGWNRQALTDTVKWEIADGQYWNAKYDPYDPFTLDSAAEKIPQSFLSEYKNGQIEPILIATGTVYPDGRSMAVMMKGIRPEQTLLELPTDSLKKGNDSTDILAIIGTGMAKQSGLKKDDVVTLRWRDTNGTFEAQDIRIAGIFSTFVPSVDAGQIWLSLPVLQKMMLKPDAATILIKSKDVQQKDVAGWNFKTVDELTKTIKETIQAKTIGQSVFYLIFLLLALLAIFDTQTLSIFRRQREIGTFVALGMTQREVVRLFTLEGTMNAVLATALGAVYGIPLCAYYAVNGIPMPSGTSDFGIAISDKIYPAYPPQLIFGVIIFIVLITALVSYLPARRIAKMKPTDAIRGKIQ
ncbi:Similar to lipoprotein releasing system transmembrane protein [uncultured Paludibacter sp.]|uniref:Similar to lipoprotein releasing system transmembrane protein n=1 Tax=uncultured Paludibacter sp. TaxID=497635 RepID=A0A653ACF2_9BACT|nr:Similar to lipoprotein releasing system transmembrane protein [uncultured Paludibacter sp.]